MFADFRTAIVALCLSQVVAADYWFQCTVNNGTPLFKGSKSVTWPSSLSKAQGAVTIDDVSWGVAKSASVSGGSSNGKVTVSDFTVIKSADAQSATLFGKTVGTLGQSPNDACYVVYTTSSSSGNPTPLFWWIMKSTVITSYSISGATDRPEESITLTFTSIEMDAATIDQTGKQTSVGFANWNLQTSSSSKRAVEFKG